MLELLFHQIDARDASTIADDRHNLTAELNRQEFLQAIVRIAVERYVACGRILDLSDAVDRVCRHDICPKLPRAATQNSNTFRLSVCYTQHVDAVLHRHLGSLRALYARYADLPDHQGTSKSVVSGPRHKQGTLEAQSMMSAPEWMALCEHLGLIELGLVSGHELKLLFTWSRIRCVQVRAHPHVASQRRHAARRATRPTARVLMHALARRRYRARHKDEGGRSFRLCARSWLWQDHSDRWQVRVRHLSFEDFLEAICRLALLIPQPTADDLAHAEADDAPSFMLSLFDSREELVSFVRARRCSLCEPSRVPAARQVEALVCMLFQIVEVHTHGDPRRQSAVGQSNGVLSLDEVTRFCHLRIRGTPLRFAAAQPLTNVPRTRGSLLLRDAASVISAERRNSTFLAQVERAQMIADEEDVSGDRSPSRSARRPSPQSAGPPRSPASTRRSLCP
jgi:hypothetical protein